MSRLHAAAKPVQFHKAADQHRVHSARIARISRSAIKAARREARLGTATVNAALVSLVVAEENHLARSPAQRDELISNRSVNEKGRENFAAFFVDCGQLDSVQSPTPVAAALRMPLAKSVVMRDQNFSVTSFSRCFG